MQNERCVAHPSRPAVDHCPNCSRPRCGADATGPKCAVCSREQSIQQGRAPSELELLVRAALASYGMALVLGYVILQEYAGSPLFTYLAPALGGIAVAMVATAASGEPRGPLRARVRIIAILFSLVAVMEGIVLEGTHSASTITGDALGAYASALAGAWLWMLPPRQRVTASEDE